MPLLQRNVQLPEDDIRWFEDTYPKASLSGILTLLLSKFRDVHKITPAEYAAIAALEIKEEMEK